MGGAAESSIRCLSCAILTLSILNCDVIGIITGSVVTCCASGTNGLKDQIGCVKCINIANIVLQALGTFGILMWAFVTLGTVAGACSSSNGRRLDEPAIGSPAEFIGHMPFLVAPLATSMHAMLEASMAKPSTISGLDAPAGMLPPAAPKDLALEAGPHFALDHRALQGSCPSSCPLSWLGDGDCDAACNSAACNCDGGDCVGYPYYCNSYHPPPPTPSPPWNSCPPSCSSFDRGDGFCDSACDYSACDWDDGDCNYDYYHNWVCGWLLFWCIFVIVISVAVHLPVIILSSCVLAKVSAFERECAEQNQRPVNHQQMATLGGIPPVATPAAGVAMAAPSQPIELRVPAGINAGGTFEVSLPDGRTVLATCPTPYPHGGKFLWTPPPPAAVFPPSPGAGRPGGAICGSVAEASLPMATAVPPVAMAMPPVATAVPPVATATPTAYPTVATGVAATSNSPVPVAMGVNVPPDASNGGDAPPAYQPTFYGTVGGLPMPGASSLPVAVDNQPKV